MCATVDSQCLEYLGFLLGIYYNFDPNAHFIASVSDQKPNNGNIFVFVIAIQKKKRPDKVASFSNWDKKSNNFGDLGLGFWSQIEVMKRALHTGCLILKRMILNGSEW